MAHAMAVERCGNRVIAVLDPNPAAKDRLADEWVNSWGKFRQTLIPKHKPKLFTSPGEFDRVRGDLLIVSCPTEWHLEYARRYARRYKKVLCEKPLDYSPAAVASLPRHVKNKLLVGHNYLLHPKTPSQVSPMCSIRYSHGVPPRESHKRDCGVWWDMGTHCLAQMLHYVPESQWGQIRCLNKDITPHDARATFATGSQVFVLQAAYSDYRPGFYVDSIKLDNFDVFGAQIEAIEQGVHPATYDMAYAITRLASEVEPYSIDAQSDLLAS